MAKPLVSNDPKPQDVSFRNFGVLDVGGRSKASTIISFTINVTIVLLLVVLGMVVKTNPQLAKQITALTVPPKPPEPKPIPKPPPPPPKPLPEPPKIKLDPPKIKITPPVLEKVPEIKPMPTPVVKPVQLNTPAPKMVNPPPAPKVVNLSAPAKAASIANNDAHPSPVRLGNPEIKALNGKPAVTPVNLGGGMHGMPPGNTGSGPASKSVNLGNGSPAGIDLKGRDVAVQPVKGLRNGVVGGTGTGVSGPKQVQLAVAQAPPPPPQVKAQAALAKPPVVTYMPKAEFTAEAKSLHIEGRAVVSVVFHANGSITVVGIVHGLGHGLDESALTAARGIRFKPALDSAGQPIDFPTQVIVSFVSNS